MCYCKATQTIYEFDSSYECIHSNAVSMKEKIERMYMLFEEKNVEVKVKRVEKVIKQTNNYDCGIFVVAYS